MQYNSNFNQIKISFPYLALAITLALTACATQYEADADADQLVAAMQDLPEVKPYLANVYFYPEVRDKSGKVEAENADDRNLTKIIIPEDQMLNLAGHASIFRWFQDDGKHPDLPLLNVHARIYKLDHSIRVVKGRMQPIAKTKIEVFLTDSNKNRIYESVFTAEGKGQEGKILRNKRETQDIYGQAIYKAMVLAFESAFADISNDLNLRPIDFDIDKIEVEEDLTDDHQAINIKQQSVDQTVEILPDAVIEDS
ncbi:MAG: hypothetical protein GKR92_11995 [Gammaproteobacteria bacterium]|nr:MAG: hypothetical protein GKR92_11995 [Gammaproteobacteria bacterium]